MSVSVPRPTDAWVKGFAIAPDLLKSGAVNPPHVARLRGKGTAFRKVYKARPRHGDFYRPATVNFIPLVQGSVNVNGCPQTRQVPIEKAPTFTSWMDVTANTIEHHRPLTSRIEFGTTVKSGTRF